MADMSNAAHDNDWLSPEGEPPSIPPAADAAGKAQVRRINGQGEEYGFDTLEEAILADPWVGDLEQRLVDPADHTFAEVDGRLVVRVGKGPSAYTTYCWREELDEVRSKTGEPCEVVRVLPEWRFTIYGQERLAIENDRRRAAERGAA